MNSEIDADVLLKIFSNFFFNFKKEDIDYNALWLYVLWIGHESPGV